MRVSGKSSLQRRCDICVTILRYCRESLQDMLYLKKTADIEVLNHVVFNRLDSPFPPQHARYAAWMELAKGPMIIPFMIALLSKLLPPMTED